MRTSHTHPIRVDFLPTAASGLGGKIGLTFAPGKRDGARWNRDLLADVTRLRETYDASMLISLIEDFELPLLKIDELFATVRDAGIRLHRLPIRDGGVPRDTGEVVLLVRTILEAAGAGDTVVIHCKGGLGRAGLVGACCLVGLGSEPREAIVHVRTARPDTLENDAQEAFVQEFARAWRVAALPTRPR